MSKLSEQQKQDMAEGMFPFHDSHSIEDKQSQILQRDAFVAGLEVGLSHAKKEHEAQYVIWKDGLDELRIDTIEKFNENHVRNGTERDN